MMMNHSLTSDFNVEVMSKNCNVETLLVGYTSSFVVMIKQSRVSDTAKLKNKSQRSCQKLLYFAYDSSKHSVHDTSTKLNKAEYCLVSLLKNKIVYKARK